MKFDPIYDVFDGLKGNVYPMPFTAYFAKDLLILCYALGIVVVILKIGILRFYIRSNNPNEVVVLIFSEIHMITQ